MYKLIIFSILFLGFLIFLPVPSAFASDLGGRMVNNSSQYSGCHGGNYYYGNWGGVDSCNGLPNYTVKLCTGPGFTSCRTDPTLDNWDGPRYGWEFGAGSDFDAKVEPLFDNGTNTPDGTVFDHWETYAVDDYGGKQPSQAGTTIQASIHVYDPYHNGLWFFYKSPPPPPPNTNPTTLPTPGTPSCISPANGATSVNSSSVIFDWGSATNASYYYFRLDNLTTGQSNLISTGPLTNLFYGPVTLNPATNYQYRVIARNSSPGNSPGAYGPEVTCPFSTQPILGAQGRGPGPDAAGSGVGISGLRADDPNVAAGTGSNTFNSVKIAQPVNGATTSNVKLVGAAFTSKGSPPVNSSLYEMTRSAYSNNGFVLIYAAQAASTVYKTPNWWDANQTFIPGRYYLYRQGSWAVGLNGEDITNDIASSRGYTTPDNSLKVKLDINNQVPNNPVFDVTPLQASGSRTWGTYGYLMDSSNAQTAQSF